MANIVLYAVIAFILFEFLLAKTLAFLNLKTWSQALPEPVKNLYDSEKYSKAKQYATANFKAGLFASVIMQAVTICFLYFKGFAWLDELVRNYFTSSVMQSLAFFGVIGLATFLLGLPFELYDTFVIEERFGFNKITASVFVSDKVKSLLLGALVGGGLLTLLTLFFGWLGNMFWLIAWVLIAAVAISFAMFYTNLLLPLFNKLTPLQSGELRSGIEEYAAGVQFPLTNILVMDGSKRSTKANAFFSGLGNKKNIVLYDNLINEITTKEIIAVLAHEVGHYKKKHVLQSMILSVLQMGLLLFVFGMVAANPLMAEMLGAHHNSFHLSLITFSLLYSPISLITGIAMNAFSRKNEYEADSYAQHTYSAEPLIAALKKLSVNHLSNLQPHRAFVFVNYSHPTLLQRIQNLNSPTG